MGTAESFLARWGCQPHHCCGSSHAFLTQPARTPLSSDLGHSVLRTRMGVQTEGVSHDGKDLHVGPSPWSLPCPWILYHAQMVLPSPPTQLKFS